jgi:4-hydroxy-3-methylbut-2-enyl diphosphate reductase IspH
MMQVLLANPRGFCAGVDRAITIVERALGAQSVTELSGIVERVEFALPKSLGAKPAE